MSDITLGSWGLSPLASCELRPQLPSCLGLFAAALLAKTIQCYAELKTKRTSTHLLDCTSPFGLNTFFLLAFDLGLHEVSDVLLQAK